MSPTELVSVLAGVTALVVAVGHTVLDITGLMDKLRRTPISSSSPPVKPPG